ncbi:U32 family peptidase [Methanoculleus sp. DTU007]|uniref:U32 family peptidase n=1 Tax=Methanoculleus sp. DTU007 TaxID=1671626 RepID=UPI00257D78D2|nr:U32 family peptidase [Methanoculleus sp. DTU007]
MANAVETCLIDHLPRIAGMGIAAVAIDARGRGPRYAEEVAGLYRAGLDAVGRGAPGTLSALKEEARRRALGGITGGHFVRGIEE